MIKKDCRIYAVIILAFLVYSNTFYGGFITDDFDQIVDDTAIKNLLNIPSFFTGGLSLHSVAKYYRPVFTLSLALDHSIWGLNPFGYHLTNTILHVCASILLYFLSKKLFKSNTPAFIAALIFSVHPVHSEAVAWIAARNEPLCALFVFLSLYLYLSFRETGKISILFSSLISFTLALLSKETAVILPFLIVLYELCFIRKDTKNSVRASLLYFGVLLGYLILRAVILDRPMGDEHPFLVRLFTGFVIMKEYLRLLFFPLKLHVFYRELVPLQETFFNKDVLLSFTILIAVGFAAFWLAKREKKFIFAIAWVFITSFPASGFPVIINISPMAERYLYLPSAGFAMFAGLAFYHLEEFVREKGRYSLMVWGVFLILIIFLFFKTYTWNKVWSSNFSYAQQMVKDAPNYYEAHNAVGVEHMLRARYDEAEQSFKKAIQLSPPKTYGVYLNLGLLYTRQGRYTEAENILKTVALNAPQFAGQAYHNLGLLFMQNGNIAEAEKAFLQAVAADPKNLKYLYQAGLLYLDCGRFEEAKEFFERAIIVDPSHADSHNNLGIIALKQGDRNRAIYHFSRAFDISPDNSGFKKNLQRAEQLK